jgi:hypothetical protein
VNLDWQVFGNDHLRVCRVIIKMQRLIGTLLVMFIFVYVGQLFETRQVMNTSKVCNVHLRIDWAGYEHDWKLAM